MSDTRLTLDYDGHRIETPDNDLTDDEIRELARKLQLAIAREETMLEDTEFRYDAQPGEMTEPIVAYAHAALPRLIESIRAKREAVGP